MREESRKIVLYLLSGDGDAQRGWPFQNGRFDKHWPDERHLLRLQSSRHAGLVMLYTAILGDPFIIKLSTSPFLSRIPWFTHHFSWIKLAQRNGKSSEKQPVFTHKQPKTGENHRHITQEIEPENQDGGVL